ncbi:MAG: alanine racemase [Spirochaetia bacterium]|nr:alanine racemase [Spirochaetia bacterium]
MLTWLDISREALLKNVASLKAASSGARFMAVVKSNAYGHGLAETAGILAGNVDWFGVNAVAEAATIRSVDPSTPILVMGAQDESDLKTAAGLSSVHVTLSSLDDVKRIARTAPGLPFHLKVDTGMSRLGAGAAHWAPLAGFLNDSPSLLWSGLMTHFANVEDVTDHEYAMRQLSRFHEAYAAFDGARRGRTVLRHAAASAPALILPESRLDMVRCGIALYGLWPSRETRLSALKVYDGRIPELEPALSWKARLVHVNRVAGGSYVGYGCTYKVARDTDVGVVPVGYFEGYERALSNRAHVIVRGRRARILGRVCMNMIMADVTDIPGAAPGDEVVLIGRDQSERVGADDLADLTSTINYEVVSRIQSDIPRIVR